MFSHIFKLTFANTWMEVSEGVEKFIIKNGGHNFIKKNSLVSQYIDKQIFSLHDDGFHYEREINGVLKSKIIVGTIKFNTK